MNFQTKKLIKQFIGSLELLPVKYAVFNNNSAEAVLVVKYSNVKKLASRYRKKIERAEIREEKRSEKNK